MTNVAVLPGCTAPTNAPNEVLVAALRDVLAMAESGQLQSYVGVGYTHDKLVVKTWCDFHGDRYQMLGAIAWLEHEYVARRT